MSPIETVKIIFLTGPFKINVYFINDVSTDAVVWVNPIIRKRRSNVKLFLFYIRKTRTLYRKIYIIVNILL